MYPCDNCKSLWIKSLLWCLKRVPSNAGWFPSVTALSPHRFSPFLLAHTVVVLLTVYIDIIALICAVVSVATCLCHNNRNKSMNKCCTLRCCNHCLAWMNLICNLSLHRIRLANDTYSTRRLHPGLPIDLHGQGFDCPAQREERKWDLIILHCLYCLWTLCQMCVCLLQTT